MHGFSGHKSFRKFGKKSSVLNSIVKALVPLSIQWDYWDSEVRMPVLRTATESAPLTGAAKQLSLVVYRGNHSMMTKWLPSS